MKRENIFEQIRSTISASDLDDAECRKLQEMMHHLESRSVQILVVGATGSGKSITINSLFDLSVAKVGTGTDPETKAITSYTLENLTLWDGPGLGDNVDCDESYTGTLHFSNQKNDITGRHPPFLAESLKTHEKSH